MKLILSILCVSKYLIRLMTALRSVHYVKDLHDHHNPLPFLPEHINDRLIPNLQNKVNYRLHIEHLILAMRHGLILQKVHKIIQFNQREILKSVSFII